MKKEAAVIGAGIGGLASACLLAADPDIGNVTVYEQNASPGGKMQQVTQNGFRFDTGPSLLTMPFLLEKLFEQCGASMKEYLELTELHPLCRYFYTDGVIFDNYSSREETLREIRNFAPQDTESYTEFLDHTERLYQKTADAFLFNPLYGLRDLRKLHLIDFLGIDAFSTVADKVDTYFSSRYLKQFFKRFTTYNGSSPYKAPATLNVIPHVELNQGGYYVKGGLYSIANALYNLCKTLDVDFHFNTPVDSILTRKREVTGLTLQDGTVVSCDLLFANSDATDTLLNLLPENTLSARKRRKQASLEPSCSGFVLLLGCNRIWKQLRHHNIFFSDEYQREFEDIFERGVLPEDPTIYISNTSFSDPGHAPAGGSNLFILVNAPYENGQDWEKLKTTYSTKIIRLLEQKGLTGLQASVDFRMTITPEDFLKRYGSNRGSIYGTSSNSPFSAFLRPRNKLRELNNLYLVGGSTHPGGGIPLVVQSAFNALRLFQRQRDEER